MQHIYIVHWSYVDHCCAFSTLEAAQQQCDDNLLTWSHFSTDMANVEMWISNLYPLHGPEGGEGHVAITKYPLDQPYKTWA